MDPLVHFEIPVDDIKTAKKFYNDVFGWKLQDWPMPDGSTYVGVHTTPINEETREPLKPGAINGGILKRNANVPTPTFAVKVASIDASMKKLIDAGGKETMPKMDMMGMGFLAYAKDPSGNVISMWEDAVKKD